MKIKEESCLPGNIHNQQMLMSQHEIIFSLDDLKEEIINLNETIKKQNKQNSALERSNLKLQKIMFLLTFVTTTIAVISFSKSILDFWSWLFPTTQLSSPLKIAISVTFFDLVMWFVGKSIEKI